jgi:hypothetical protein
LPVGPASKLPLINVAAEAAFGTATDAAKAAAAKNFFIVKLQSISKEQPQLIETIST